MKYIKVLLILSLLSLVTSCAAMDPITPVSYTLLLVKIRDLLCLCCLLLDQSEVYHGQVISRLYYAYYHLARLLHININDEDAGGHSKTWKNISDEDIKSFGFQMKLLREKYDYDAIDLSDATENELKDDFIFVLNKKETAIKLMEELKNTLNRCNYLTDEDQRKCEEIIAVIKSKHEILLTEINNRYK